MFKNFFPYFVLLKSQIKLHYLEQQEILLNLMIVRNSLRTTILLSSNIVEDMVHFNLLCGSGLKFFIGFTLLISKIPHDLPFPVVRFNEVDAAKDVQNHFLKEV